MNLYFVTVLLVFCGFAVTDAQARPRTQPDAVASVGTQDFVLENLGPADLSGIWLPKDVQLGLKEGDKVDVKAVGEDRYGRTEVLLYKKGAKITLQEQLLGEGKALVHDRAATPAAWRVPEASAKKAKRGLWAAAPLPTAKMGEHLGEMARTRGKVVRTYKSRTMHYINFKEDWRTDFSVRIPRASWRAFGKNFEVADGTCVEARGYVFMDNGPMIELTRPEQLEILDANACAG